GRYPMPRTPYLIILVMAALILPACVPQVVSNTPLPSPEITTPLAPTALVTPAPRVLNICLGGEPNTLYPYGSPNSPARSVISAIFDGPIDIAEYDYKPIILEKIPNLKDGDVQISPIPVKAGDQVINANGDVAALSTGMKVRP